MKRIETQMRPQEINILANMLVKHSIPSGVVAKLIHLNEAQTTEFNHKIDSLLKSLQNDNVSVDKNRSVERELQHIITRYSILEHRSGNDRSLAHSLDVLREMPELDFQNSEVGYLSLTNFFLSVVIAADEYALEASAHSSAASYVARNATVGVLAQSTNLAKGVAENAQHAIISGIGVGADLIIGGVKELHHHFENNHKDKHLKETIAKSEEKYIELHHIYANITAYFTQSLSDLEIETLMCSQSTIDQQTKNEKMKGFTEQREALVADWVDCERLFHNEVKKIQQDIAIAGALAQRLQSERRVDRVYNAFSAASSALTFTGPPGLIAASVLKTAAIVGVFFTKRWIGESAYFNQGVRRNNLIFITDQNSVEEAKKQILKGENIFLGISGPIVGQKSITETMHLRANNILMKPFDVEPLLRPIDNRAFCSFSFDSPLPNLPDLVIPKDKQDFSTDKELKKQGKIDMWDLVRAEQQISYEAWYLFQLAAGLKEKCKAEHRTLPCIVNIQEQIQALEHMHKNITAKMKIISKQMGPQYHEEMKKEGQANEGARGISQFIESAELFEHNMKNLKILEQSIQHASLHAALVNYQQETVENREAMKPRLVQAYTHSEEARETLLKDIEFKLTAIESVVQTCIEQNSGEGISNLGAAIKEIHEQLEIIRSGCEKSPEQLARFAECHERNRQLCTQQYLLNQNRLVYLRDSTDELLSPEDRYFVLNKLQEDQANIPRGANGYSSPQISDEEFQSVRTIFRKNIEGHLRNPSTISMAQISGTQAIVSPSRVFFGFTKHSDMEKAVQQKAHELSRLGHTKIQINPLLPIDEDIIALCKKDFRKFQLTIEGLKTEIQWINQFSKCCKQATPQIEIANFQQLSAYYQRQLHIVSEAFSQSQNQSRAIKSDPKSVEEYTFSIPHSATHASMSAYEQYSIEVELKKAHEVFNEIAIFDQKAADKPLPLPVSQDALRDASVRSQSSSNTVPAKIPSRSGSSDHSEPVTEPGKLSEEEGEKVVTQSQIKKDIEELRRKNNMSEVLIRNPSL